MQAGMQGVTIFVILLIYFAHILSNFILPTNASR